jgi:uncharacterized protein
MTDYSAEETATNWLCRHSIRDLLYGMGQSRRFFVVGAVLLDLLRCPFLCGSESPEHGATRELRPDVRIPMRDGVKLAASIYLPKTGKAGNNGRTPVIVTLTPYLRHTWEPWASYFASHGYGFASIDVRGRGDSDGEFEPYVHEARDGYDAVEWLARQPFCDGNVGMWGGSYAGFNQWAVAREFPPHLCTIIPVAAAHPGVDVPFYNNIGQPYLIEWLASISGNPLHEEAADDQAFWKEKFLSAYRKHIPFNSLDSFVGLALPSFQRFICHPLRDSYYDSLTPTGDQYRRIRIPVLTITGQYDDEAFGALTYYRNYLAHADAEAAARNYLLIGPWDHPGTRTPTDEVGGVKFGPAALLDLKNLQLQWYDWTMKHGRKPGFLKERVCYYLLGPGNTGSSGEWRYAGNLAAVGTQATTFYLDSKNGDANGVSHSGRLSETRPQKGSERFAYDPMDIQRGESIDGTDREKGELIDPRYALIIGLDGLVFQTAPFAEKSELAGCPSLRLWLAIDTPDTDLEAYLYEIQPNGTSIRIWTHSCRLRYRESVRRSTLVKPGEIVACDLAPGLFVARRLMQGSRLRLVISCPNTIWAEKNYNSGGTVAEETAKDARTAHVQVFHDAEHTSALLIPLISQPEKTVK